MSQLVAIRLVKSLSSPEKRYFKLHTRQQTGNKDYLDLFTIIDKTASGDAAAIQQKFRRSHPASSLNNTARYLVKILTDCLIQSRIEKDPLFGLLQDIMRVKVLQERSMREEGYEQLKKIRQAAQQQQQHFVEYLTYRDELNYFADSNFQGTNDRGLIEKQMKAKDILKNISHIQDHYSLFELMKYRIVHSGKIASDDDRKRLNDLMLSEMTLVAGKSKNSFAAQKLHLLFQSYFFTDVGDYQSAFKTFHSLNKLFEQNGKLLEHPPLDYLSALNGILDSLHALGNYTEIAFYLDRLKQLDQSAYPEYFRYQVRKTIAVYQLAILAGQKQFPEAVALCRAAEAGLLKAYAMVDEEKQWELYFYYSLSYFGNKDLKKAHGYIGEIMRTHKAYPQLLVCKATRLLNIIIYYEQGETDYLEYEIRSYKRFFKEKHKLLRSETLLFKFIKIWPDAKKKKIPELLQKKMLEETVSLQKDTYEKQLLKYFDFPQWVREKVGR